MNRTKKRTSLEISRTLGLQADEMARHLGIGKGDMVSMGLAFLLVQLAPLKNTVAKRDKLLKNVNDEFHKLLADARHRSAYRG